MTINFGDTKLDLEYITINQYEKLLENQDMKDIEFISLITTLPLDELRDVKVSEIGFVATFLRRWIASFQKSPLTYTVKYKEQMLGLLDATNMTYGEFSDLHILTSAEKVDFRKVCSILYRPVVSGEGENRKIEKYDYDKCMERSEEMGDFPINNYISALFFFNEIQSDIIGRFPLVFGEKEEGRVEKPDERTRDERIADLVDFYYHTWMVMSNEDVLKIPEVQQINVQEALWYLSYMVKKNRELEAKYKNQKK